MFPLKEVKNDINIEGFHNIYYFEFGKSHSHKPECHDYWEMVYVDRGKITAMADNDVYTLEEGQAIFHSPGEIHLNISNGEVANNMLVVSFTCNNESMDFFKINKIFTLNKPLKTILSLFMQEAQNALGKIPNNYHDTSPLDFSHAKFGSSQLMKFHYIEFLVKLLRNHTESINNITNDTSITKNKLVEEIIIYLKNNVYSEINLNDICDKFFVKKSNLSTLFKKYTGKTPIQYYSDLKIEEAKKLIREGGLSVSEISDKLCYSGINVFSRAFKDTTGFSPTKYKSSIILFQNTNTNEL